MAAVNQNMFDACISNDRPRGGSLMVLPLNLIALIVSYLDDPGDLARLCRTCRVLNYMSLPQLYKNMTLTSYDKIRYRGEAPEGMGSASPFSMGLNAVITRPFASLVRRFTLRGDWRELELEEHARVGRVPDSSMMMNIAVRAAVDRMPNLESFSWELSTKMLETVYLGLTQLPKLTSLTVRFPSNRHPRPMITIPAMPHLRYLKITDIDPLCYPDDISTLLWKSKKLRDLKLHWSPRMRTAQEPSVMLHDYFRKCIAAKQPLSLKNIGLHNLYALHTEEFNLAFNQETVENVTILNNVGVDDLNFMNTFVDSSWPNNPPHKRIRIKSLRQDSLSRRHADFLGSFTGLEKIYFVNVSANPQENINCPRQWAPPGGLTPPSLDQNHSPSNEAVAPTPDSIQSAGMQTSVRDSYLNPLISNHCATLRHMLLPARWPLSSSTIARLVHASPRLEQFAFATEFSSMETLGLVLPFLRNLVALRLLVPTNNGSKLQSTGLGPCHMPKPLANGSNVFTSARSFADIVEADDEVLLEKLSESLADQQVFSRLQLFGMGRKAFQLGEYYTIPANQVEQESQVCQWQSPSTEITRDDKSPSSAPPQEDDSHANGVLTPAAGPTAPPSTAPSTGGNTPVRIAPSILGKRTRDDLIVSNKVDTKESIASSGYTYNPCLPVISNGPRIWRRRVRRVGWDVVKNWEIWGLDKQEL
ncbi:hypothetical protein EYZ11_007964 [Aspergillus tanneri]|uniref:F-box domain-containing protein n=1 Tax=Aspergillus tanneri TaxID=1220188 RepID=A0A4S3JBM7_9EURO|nr:uncharacterized protein ATNIH1004_001596 [Aspergillus tanneri]KAA8652691.1 hypothetical protein ATNIH1004_001596 [Aspergillus tanneri]THC92553.1 hypothetical protein EYZ11_007964 [Aspergillus tanneri]